MILEFLKAEFGRLYRFMRTLFGVAAVFMLIWAAYRFLPQGCKLIPLILNASGLAGAAALLGIFYNKTKNEMDRPKVTVHSEILSEKHTKALEESLKKTSAKEALNNFVEVFKKQIEENSITKGAIDFSMFIYSIRDHKEKVFTLQSGELIKAGYERECRELVKEIELSHDYSVYGLLIEFFNPILTTKYPFDDPAAENKICLDVYLCKDNESHSTANEIYGYALIYAYYNTEMFVSCRELFKRNIEDVKHVKANIQPRD